ncbi:undecaprenyldiphospho-muramoylpentapeptide beta-N-acetylglucosaminyltransferase [Acidisoma silvae]|uniref:UDP-N-acetylglucosamine--N-acetylmuramyl-(pentapeptide) pyrophosphoryl-undecaprenol N-acetylglucosamine transferase n=1 Tax=Acidisoma silvae TaxID=2802396 RepID=A0A963YQL8_9PROT|nr:undecaprenyldiphospho-muramoylpentapeptide beta-N-acetylglucosaminyltransferase [Acidisoma silvae]MCB8874565.1 undecaprenyldiphospho-muramoylpentapeptide beta-N-acetylglucosaminyltransferase [Acidisoma silvae]
MRGPRVIPVVIAAGGTGGHFFPAEALAHALAGRGYRPVLMTDGRSAGRGSEAFASGDRHVLPGAGIAGRGIVKGVKATAALAAGSLVAAKLLRALRPGAIVGFGGYPCVPPIVAAKLSGQKTPIILHEQNAVLGRANRSLAKRVSVLALSATGTTRVPAGVRTVVTGNPVRPAIMALADMPYEAPVADGPINLLVTGGSLGAKVLSDIVPQAVIALPADLRSRLRVVQQARQEDGARVRAAYDAAGITAEVAPFFADMAQRLASAHLVIARAGASTTAELTVAGRPSLLVPLPSAIDDHQSANAAILETAGAAWVLPQSRFTVEAVAARLTALLSDPAALAAASSAARSIARADAVALLADLVEQSMVRETQS